MRKNIYGSFGSPFRPDKWGDAFTEGCSLHWTWCVFHGPRGLINLMGRIFFVNKLYPYLTLAKKDKRLQPLIADVMNQQRTLLLRELYAYAFKRNTSDVSRWKVNETEMKPGV